MDKMNAVVFAATGHVLGVVTRSAEGDSPVAVDDVGLNGILIRDSQNSGLQTEIGADELQIAEVDYDSRVFYRTQLFAVTGGRAEQQIYNSASPVAVSLDGSDIDVTLPQNVTSDTEVFVHVSGGALSEAVVRPVTVLQPGNSGSENLSLGRGDYRVAIFAPGHATIVQLAPVP